MSNPVKWLLAVVVVLGLAVLAFRAFTRIRGELAQERAQVQPPATQSLVSHDAERQTVITLTSAQQAKSGLQVKPLAGQSLQPQVIAFGTLQEDPSQFFTFRAPVAGILRGVSEQSWPKAGDVLADKTRVAVIEPRLAPAEYVDLASKLAAARSGVQAATSMLAVDRAEFERIQKLNALDKIVSDRAVEEARAKMEGEEAKLNAAQETARLIQSALSATTTPTDAAPLTVERGGEVLEVAVQPGESVETGQTLLRVGRFDRLLATVALPSTEFVDPSSTTAYVVAVGHEDNPLAVEQIALAPAVDPKTFGQALLLRVNATGLGLRPGTLVTASLTLPGKAQQGVLVPRDAVVWHEGKAWAYVQAEQEKFARREVPTDRATDDGWFVTTRFSAGERVVVRGAQQLLSEEFKPVLPPGGEADND